MTVTRCVRSAGKVVVGFETGVWTVTGGTIAPRVVQGYAGEAGGVRARTGAAEMLAVTLHDDTQVTLNLTTPASALRTTALGGQFVLAVHVVNQPGYEPGGTPKGNVMVTAMTDPARSQTNALFVNFNQNGLREGCNFLKFQQRNPTAYAAGSGIVEYHPSGVSAQAFGTGAAANLVGNALTGLSITLQNLGGATVVFEKIFTGLSSVADVVLGVDQQNQNVLDYSLPLVAAHDWVGYVAPPGRIWPGGDRVLADLTAESFAAAVACYEAGWDNINHTLNHLPGTQATPNMGTLTNPAEIAYEIKQVRAHYEAAGLVRGGEFYASPQTASSRLSERVIRECGITAQRHYRKMNTTVTPWGIDNPHHLGGTNIGAASGVGLTAVTGGAGSTITGAQQFTKIKRMIDVHEAYGDAWLPYWHAVTTLGDTGTGENLTGDDLIITRSALDMTLDYLAEREEVGNLRVRDGFTGWLYGTGR